MLKQLYYPFSWSSVKYEINSNPIVIYDAMAIVRSVPSEKTWESLFQTLVKVLRTQEAEEIVLVFDKYSNNQEFFLKQQERINRVTNRQYYKSSYLRKLPKMSQVYKQYLENTENKAELI